MEFLKKFKIEISGFLLGFIIGFLIGANAFRTFDVLEAFVEGLIGGIVGLCIGIFLHFLSYREL